MAQGELTRKLAAILAADVAGYSRPMGENEHAMQRLSNGEARKELP